MFAMANYRAEASRSLQRKDPPVHFSTVGRIPLYFLNNPNHKIRYHSLRVDDGIESGEDS